MSVCRLAVLTIASVLAAAPRNSSSADYAQVTRDHAIEFPGDYGSHPDFRTEWWYVTGWTSTSTGEPLGFQITFFRTKPAIDERNPSSFTPRQLLIAHAAISDPQRGRLWQDQKIRRSGQGLAEAATGDTHVWIDGWSIKHEQGVYAANLDATDFALHLILSDTQAPLLNGEAGVSRKGPAPEAASFYYSLPHLAVSGTVSRGGRPDTVHGEAWFDHEWSSEYLDSRAVGWNWIGINMNDGAAMMAFVIRDARGAAHWAGGSYRSADGKLQNFNPGEVSFDAVRNWRSPRTGIVYPVEWRARTGPVSIELKPLMDDQENDTRLSTGAIYWEGAVRAYQRDRLVGNGYLELTGYGERLMLR